MTRDTSTSAVRAETDSDPHQGQPDVTPGRSPAPKTTAGRPEHLAADAILVKNEQAAALIGVSPATFFRLRAGGLVGPDPIRLRGSVRWNLEEFQRWIAAGCPNHKVWLARTRNA